MGDIVKKEPETQPESIKGLREQEWYKNWVEELKAQVVETEFNIRNEVIRLYHSLGQHVVEKYEDFERAKVYGKHIAETVAFDIGKGERQVQRAIQFYKKYPDLERFLGEHDKTLSWHQITQKYLPEAKEKSVEPPAQKPGEEAPVPPEIHLAWNEQAGLWDIKIDPKDMKVINLLGFKKEIDDYFANKN